MRTMLLRIVAVGWVTANLWLAPILPCGATQPDTKQDALRGQLLLIPSSDASTSMRTLVYRPPGAGPFPLAIISHGSSSNPQLRSRPAGPRFEGVTSWFIRHGYVVAVPQRPGHGETGGPYLEGYGSCENPDYLGAGIAIAETIKYVVNYMTGQGFVRKSGIVLIGHSAGGWGSLAFASQNHRSLRAVINFAGGLGGRSYDWANRNCAPDRLIKAAAEFGRSARVPTLWLYAENDSYFGLELSAQLASAFRAYGGRAEYHLLPAPETDGHFLIYEKRAVANWGKLIDAFLRR